MKITGRRRICKTTLILQALESLGKRPVYYVQIPDSGDAGVLSAVNDALDTFDVPRERFPRPRNLAELARTLEFLAESGYVVVLDEFQYFNRKGYGEFCSLLQAAADRLDAKAGQVRGGWVVLGSVHAEMEAILEERSAPLYGRVKDSLDLTHLDIASVLAILRKHADPRPDRLLWLWTLFEGVPKYYRDCHEQGVLNADRATLLLRMFFESSSPLRSEAETWFLREIGGMMDTVLKFVARNPGMAHKELVNRIQEASGDETSNIGSYLKNLTERYRLIERKLPIFAPDKGRKGRYYLTDNFLTAWMAAIASRVSARSFRPVAQLVAETGVALDSVEGIGLEKLVSHLYQDRSRRGLGDFPLTTQIRGFWDRSQVEIDLVAVNETDRRIRFGSCKRSSAKLLGDISNFEGHVDRFLNEHRAYQDWAIDYVGISVRLSEDERAVLTRHDIIPQSLDDLTAGLT